MGTGEIILEVDISDNLGVYVICKNEENLIVPCVTSLMNVFPQVQVVDLGSKDATLDRLNNLGVQVTSRACTPSSYSALKNELASGHEWVFMVDGDEIYPISSLLRFSQLIKERHRHGWHAIRCGWKFLKYEEDKLFESKTVINGPKVFRPNRFKFEGTWPYEVLKQDSGNKGKRKQPVQHCDTWCWHGKLLHRSHVRDRLREEKREAYENELMKKYHGEVSWKRRDCLPWENV